MLEIQLNVTVSFKRQTSEVALRKIKGLLSYWHKLGINSF